MSTARSANDTGPRRYLNANSSDAAFDVTVGVAANPPLDSGDDRIFPVGKSLIATLIFFGSHTDLVSSADNLQYNYRVFGVHRPLKFDGTLGGMTMRTYLGAGAVTLGSQTGVAGDAVGAAEYFADTLTWTPSGVATAPAGPLVIAEGALSEGTSAAYTATAADNKHTFLFLPHLVRCTGLIVDFAQVSGTVAMNCLIMVDEV